MKLAHVYLEYQTLSLNHTFTYDCQDLPVERGMRVKVPFGNRLSVGFVDHVEEVERYEGRYQLKAVYEVLDEKPLINEELFALAKQMSYHYVAPMISCFQAMLPSKIKPRSHKDKVVFETWIEYVMHKRNPTKRQLEVLDEMKVLQSISKREFLMLYKSVGTRLIKEGCFRELLCEKEALLQGERLDVKKKLSAAQEKAFAEIKAAKQDVVLLHGMTGSGKTELYLQLAQEVVEAGETVLLLVPEIALTPQMVKRVTMRFGADVAIYHSGLSPQQKYEQYQLVAKGRVHIVVGTRSAVFMPFAKLGLIVMDEEHDNSYKQDQSPRYHCRDVALWRGRYHHCKVLLGSATPSLESYARAYKQVYGLVSLKERINKQMPKIDLVDMKGSMRKGAHHLIAPALKEAIEQCVMRKEQVILLLNRRGHTPILRCGECGEVLHCPHCDSAMAYHKQKQVLKCHICDTTTAVPTACPNCHATQSFEYIGYGTQRMEEALLSLLPGIRVLRMDRDTTTQKDAHERLLEQFENQEYDILLGTQMIAKGLDFENVTLVGILNADAGLARSDYACVEETFDLLYQACGRSGRGAKAGRVMMQVFDTEHYAVRCAMLQDYEQFFYHEMRYRHLAGYPPYRYLSSVVLHHAQSDVAREESERLLAQFQGRKDILFLGVSELGKRMDRFRFRILMKSKDQDRMIQLLHEMYAYHASAKMRTKIELDSETAGS